MHIQTSPKLSFLFLFAIFLVSITPNLVNNIASLEISQFLTAQAATQDFSGSQLELSVSPPTAYIKVQPGSHSTHTITLENTGNNTVVVSPQIVDFKPDGRTGIPILQQNLSFPYLELPEGGFGSVTLEAKQTAQLTLKFDVPKSAETREYPMSIIFHRQKQNDHNLYPNSTTNANSHSSISGSIASNFIVLISKDDLKPNLKINKIEAPLITDSLKPLKFVPILENPQLAATAASGSATLSNWKGEVVASLELFPEVILGGSTREAHSIKFSAESPPEPGLFSVDKFLIGPYVIKVKLIQTDEQGTNTILDTSSKLVFTFPYVGFIAIGLLISIFSINFLRKKWLIKSRDY